MGVLKRDFSLEEFSAVPVQSQLPAGSVYTSINLTQQAFLY